MHLVVVADEMEVERSSKALEKQSRVQADAALVEVRCQSTDSAAGVKMGPAPVLAHRLDRNADLSALGFGELPQLCEEIGVDLNR